MRVMMLQITERVYNYYSSAIAVPLQYYCSAIAVPLQCHCMPLQCCCAMVGNRTYTVAKQRLRYYVNSLNDDWPPGSSPTAIGQS